MPKKTLNFVDFSGGLCEGGDPRDIPANCFSVFNNCFVDERGVIKMNNSRPTIVVNRDMGYGNSENTIGGYGFFIFKNDRRGLGHLHSNYNAVSNTGIWNGTPDTYTSDNWHPAYINECITAGSVNAINLYDASHEKAWIDGLIGWKCVNWTLHSPKSGDVGAPSAYVVQTITDNGVGDLTLSATTTWTADDMVVIYDAPLGDTEYGLRVNQTTGAIICYTDYSGIAAGLLGYPSSAAEYSGSYLGYIINNLDTGVAGNDLKPVFYQADGDVRIGDASHNDNVHTKFVGYVDNRRSWGLYSNLYGCDELGGKWVSCPSMIQQPKAPNAGNLVQSWSRTGDYPWDGIQGYFTMSGNHSTILTINAIHDHYLEDNVLIGLRLWNVTDGSYGTITDNDATTITVGSLTGGDDNSFDSNDKCFAHYDGYDGSSSFKNGAVESKLSYFHEVSEYHEVPGAVGLKIFNNLTASGGWTGTHDFWMSYVYMDDQESLLTFIGDDEHGDMDGTTNQKKQIDFVIAPKTLAFDEDTSGATAGVYSQGARIQGSYTAHTTGYSIPRGQVWIFPPRVKGFRIYWSDKTDQSRTSNDKWLLYDVDMNKGFLRGDQDLTKSVSSGIESSWTDIEPWSYGYTGVFGDNTAAPNLRYSNACFLSAFPHSGDRDIITFDNPPKLYTYEQMSGLNYDEESICVKSFGTGVIANRRAYIGNIVTLEGGGVTKTYPDRIVKSLVNKFDTFPVKYGKIDVAVNDGESIIHLEEFADRLLQFKEDSLHILNISQDVEFLEASYQYKGVTCPSAVCKTDAGVAWVNKHGCFFYTGEQLVNLHEKKGMNMMDLKNWATNIGSQPNIWFNPTDKTIGIMNESSPVALSTSSGPNSINYTYDLVHQCWSDHRGGTGNQDNPPAQPLNHSDLANTDSFTNIQNLTSLTSDTTAGVGTPVAMQDDNMWAVEGLTARSDDDGLYIATRDFDFGEPNVRKKIYKVYITYSVGATCEAKVRYCTNGSSTEKLFTGVSGYNHSTDDFSSTGGTSAIPVWSQAELKPATSSEANSVYSFKLIIRWDEAGGVGTRKVQEEFMINDITIVYRMKGIK